LLRKKKIAEEKEKDMARNMLNGKSTHGKDEVASQDHANREVN
jgi:hypothetical protein